MLFFKPARFTYNRFDGQYFFGVPVKGSCLRSRLKGPYFNTEFYS